jgi:hypothetical protein
MLIYISIVNIKKGEKVHLFCGQFIRSKYGRVPVGRSGNFSLGCKRIEAPPGIRHLGWGMTYKEFYAQALLNSLSIAYAVEKDLLQGREPTPENVALGASQLAMALTDVLASTAGNVPDPNVHF